MKKLLIAKILVNCPTEDEKNLTKLEIDNLFKKYEGCFPSEQRKTDQALSLRALIIEMLGESAEAYIESEIAINTKFIAKAVESTNCNINRTAVLGNLDVILAKEVDMGCFIKIGEDQYKISTFSSASFDPKTAELILQEIGKIMFSVYF